MLTEKVMTKICGALIGAGVFMALGIAAAHAQTFCG